MKYAIVAIVLVACGAPRTNDGLYRSGRMHELRDRLRGERAASPDVAARNAILLARVYIDLRVVWDAATFDDASAALAGAKPVDPRLVAELEQATGEVVFWRKLVGGEGEWGDVRARFERALELRTNLRDARGIAESTFYRGLIAQFTGTTDEARGWFERARELGRAVDDPLLHSYPVRHLADLAEQAGDLAKAGTLHREALVLRERAGDEIRLFNARLTLATFLCERMRDCEAARPQIEAAQRTVRALRLPHGAVEVAMLEAQLAEWRGDLRARDGAWKRTLELAIAAKDREAITAVRMVLAAERLRVRSLEAAIHHARAAGTPDGQAIVVEAALLTGDVAAADEALAAAWAATTKEPSTRLQLATAAWLAVRSTPALLQLIAARSSLPRDPQAWRAAALATARREHDLRAELDVLLSFGDPAHIEEARRLAASAKLPLHLP